MALVAAAAIAAVAAVRVITATVSSEGAMTNASRTVQHNGREIELWDGDELAGRWPPGLAELDSEFWTLVGSWLLHGTASVAALLFGCPSFVVTSGATRA